MNTRIAAIAVAATLLAGTAQAAILFDNGPIVDGANLSILPAGAGTLGWASTSSFRVADNFTVSGASWNVESISFYAYQTNAGAFSFTGATWSIIAGNDVNAGTVVASGTGGVSNGGLVGYRVTPTTLTSTARAIYRITADMPDFTLASGNYFLAWALAGTSSSGPFVPGVLGSLGSGNALQGPTGGAFATVTDGNLAQPVDLPFTINGTATAAVPEPASWAMMLIGFGGVAGALRARRRATSVVAA